MVTPVAKRQPVDHIRGVLALSERRACALACRVARYISTKADDASCASVCGNWRASGAVLDTAA
ncbi:hypothetical protein AA14362_2080 [Acetobacter cerevisiae DSM 14362]|nr:hypothetical protein AA14362_2080 [Acetobacter cerevisiae DSM 14362]